MSIETAKYKEIIVELGDKVVLIAVSKTKPVEDISELYHQGQRDFGENYVQELVDKQKQLPQDIRWHFIGHLQSNKVKFVAPFVSLIQGVDSYKLLVEINKQAEKCNRVIDCLLQVHIAVEETKFGFNEEELVSTLHNAGLAEMKHIRVAGLMGMASFTETKNKIREEFKSLKSLFDKCANLSSFDNPLSILSMGMSSDYTMAIEEGSNMVRIGSLIFGERVHPV